jgi:hypothetical protein
VAAGEHWPNCPVAPPTTPATSEAPANRTDEGSTRAKASPPASNHVSAATPPTAPSATSSALAEENALYARAMREKQHGRSEAALASLDELIATHPNGPLVESAYLQRMRVLASSDRSHATAAAREYLQRYPSGFGRDEAAALVGERP